jgi:hypothetical protein
VQYNSDFSSTNWINLGSPVTAIGATLSTQRHRHKQPATVLPTGALAVAACRQSGGLISVFGLSDEGQWNSGTS